MKRKTNIIVVILAIIMAIALSITLISCGNDDKGKTDADVKDKQETVLETDENGKVRDEADVSSKTEKKDVKSDTGKSEKNKSDVAKSDEKKSEGSAKQTTQATTQAPSVCYVSVDGYCSSMAVSVQGGDTAYSVLCRTGASVSGSGSYVRGINGLFEFDRGPQSGWMYSVNGYVPNVSCGSYSVKAGDSVRWYYVTSY